MAKECKELFKKRGAPIKTFDWGLVDAYLSAGCSGIQIAAKFDIHEDTLYARCKQDKKMLFSAYARSKKDLGLADLRLAYYDLALDGNASLLKDLGNEYLGFGKQDKAIGESVEQNLGIALANGQVGEIPTIPVLSPSTMETRESLPHQGCSGKEDQVQPELGTEDPASRPSSLQDNPQG